MAELQRDEITARIKQARLESGLTQPEIADLLDVSMRTYQNYEATRVPWSQINAIATATGKTTEWLLHGDPKPQPDLMAAFGNGDRLVRIEQKLDALLEERESMRDLARAIADLSAGDLDAATEAAARAASESQQPSTAPDTDAPDHPQEPPATEHPTGS